MAQLRHLGPGFDPAVVAGIDAKLHEVEEVSVFMGFMAEDRKKLKARIEREMARLERERPPSTLSEAQRALVDRTSQRLGEQLWPKEKEG